MKKTILVTILLLPFISFAQSDLEKVLKGGEILVNGLSFFKSNKTKSTDSKFIESLCVKNKLTDKISFILIGTDQDGNTIKKELVIQKDGKECLLELSKGIYTYEIILSNKEIFKKGEYKFIEDLVITIKND